MALDTDVLIVGAGPIGLVNAWAMKQLNPRLNIEVLEKYEEYQRSHTLIMQADQLEKVMVATYSMEHPELKQLLTRLRKDPHIRTNELQKIFSDLAKNAGVSIVTKKEITDENIDETLKGYPNLRFMIGADGTHSVVSKNMFGADNQEKHEFDFVLQLRFEVTGEQKAETVDTIGFLNQMVSQGIISSEYVGHFADGKTPITMQMMICKSDFIAMQSATSKNPVLFFNADDHAAVRIPNHLRAFIAHYLSKKTKQFSQNGDQIDQSSVKISVNEAPATHAKKLFVTNGATTRVVLQGDSALGLSYFKGLNAGMEACARFLTELKPSIQNSFADTDVLDQQLQSYEDWFLNDYSPKKVKEVESYSFWQIRLAMRVVEGSRSIKMGSFMEPTDDHTAELRNYYRHYRNELSENWRPYPHRSYQPVQFWEWGYVPVTHTAVKIGKLFADFVKPYKSAAQAKQDFKLPLVALAHLLIGLFKVIRGIVSLLMLKPDAKIFVDGLFTLFQSAIEFATWPLAWTVKPAMRGLATLIHGGYKKIEENVGMQHLAELGLAKIANQELSTNDEMYEVISISNDMHRKFKKADRKGQDTNIGNEQALFSKLNSADPETAPNKDDFANYFRLFTPKKAAAVDLEAGAELNLN